MTHPTPYQAQRIEAASEIIIENTIMDFGNSKKLAQAILEAADSIPHPEPSAEVVERVAKAIYDCDVDDGWTWKTDVQANRDKCLHEAKAAIRAMQQGEK